MTHPKYSHHLQRLRSAFNQGDLTLYLGAGVSVQNGLPPWERLVLAMYFSAISSQSMGHWRPFPNYLFAIAEWHLGRSHEPLDITARRIRKYFTSPDAFMRHLKETLYAGFADDGSARFEPLEREKLRSANPTLNAVAELCERSSAGKGVRAVITENYDSLLEIALGQHPFQSIWNSALLEHGKLPIYHVHGFVPVVDEPGSSENEIIFTEEQYYLAAQDAYSWSNLIQLQSMSSSVGLMVGMSLEDRNMRRLLDAAMKTPLRSENYLLIQEPQWKQADDEELDYIHTKAKTYFKTFKESGAKQSKGETEVGGVQPGIKEDEISVPGTKSGDVKNFESRPGIKGAEYRSQITGVIGEVERLDVEQRTFVLEQLGVRPIWYKEHNEIPGIIAEVFA